MALTCSISGEIAQEPVLAPSSKHIFERRLIEKHIDQMGTDPISNDPLGKDELLPIAIGGASFVKARSASMASIPTTLKALQDEWDALMLQNFNLKQHVQLTRQELSHALYQHDAACRVIARLQKELRAAKEALSTLKPPSVAPIQTTANGEGAADISALPESAVAGESAESSTSARMTNEVIEKIQDKANELTSERKQRGKSASQVYIFWVITRLILTFKIRKQAVLGCLP